MFYTQFQFLYRLIKFNEFQCILDTLTFAENSVSLLSLLMEIFLLQTAGTFLPSFHAISTKICQHLGKNRGLNIKQRSFTKQKHSPKLKIY